MPAAAFTHRQIVTILSGLMLGILLAALDQTIVSTAIRTIADDLHGLNLQAWTTTAYLITATISTPLYGKLSDLYGRKPFYLAAISIFIVGSVLCTISTSMYELAAFRAVQGLGAGGLMSLAFAIIGDIVPPRERARYQGYFLAVFGSASVVGPLLGGGFAGAEEILGIAGWRWVFLVNVPIAAAALIVVARVLNIPHTRREPRIDWGGAVALTVAVVPVLLVAEQGREWGWGSTGSIVCYVIAVVGFVGFIIAERAIGDDALLPLRLFRRGVFSVTSASGLLIGMGMFGGLVLIPLYLQIVKGASPTKAGLLLLPLMAGIIVGSMITGQLTARTGRYKIFPVLGTAVMTASLLLLDLRLGVDTSLVEAGVFMALFGLGLGGCLQTLIVAVQNAVPPRDMGVATASATFFRQMGGTLGVAVFLSILFSTVGNKIAEAFRAIAPTSEFQAALADPAVRANPANDVVVQAVRGGGSANASGVLQDSSFLQHIDSRLARPFLVGFSDAMDGVFLVAAGVMFLAFVLILFMEEIPLRNQSGIEALAAELTVETGEAAPRDEAVLVTASRSPTDAPVRHDVMLARGGARLSGTVSAAGSGQPLADVVVTLIDVHGDVVGTTITGAEGRFGFRHLAEGRYTVIVTAPTAHPAAHSVDVPAYGEVAHDLTMVARVQLMGRVRTASTGAPVPEALTTLLDSEGRTVGSAITDADGEFLFEDLPAGAYTVIAAGYAPVAAEVHLAFGTPTETVITMQPPGVADAALRNGAVRGGIVERF
jgi:EmrB/QacA subfamily drug resistance transporter